MPAHHPTRRQFLARAGAAGASLALSGCRRGRHGGKQELRVFVYSGGHEKTMREVFVPEFEKQTGATVVLDAGWWDSIPKLKASPPDDPAFDLVVIDATQGYPAFREGLFQKLDLANIPNHKNLTPCVLDNWVFREGYGITFPGSVMTLAYRPDLVAFRPTGWGDLLRDEVSGKVGLYNSLYMSLYTFACMKVARQGKPGTAAAEVANNLDGVLDFARANRRRIGYWWPTSTNMLVGLAKDNCVIGNMHSPEMLEALKDRPTLAAVVPEADRAFVQVAWSVPRGTPRKALAEAAINLIFSESMQQAFARHGSPTAVLSAARAVAAADPLWRQIYPSTETQFRSLLYYPYDAYFRDWDHVNQVWDREILRKG